jgi:hypothetical protein
MTSVFDAARACFVAEDPQRKVELTQAYAAAFMRGELTAPDDAPAP